MAASRKVRKAVIPAAGLGTRFLPATKAIPKEMLPIVDIPTIQYIVEEVVESGLTDVVFVTGRNKEAIDRIDDGTYGKCEECGEIIGLERLKARPVTTLCIDCKSLQEAEERKLRGVP